jgi:hypothetical protein
MLQDADDQAGNDVHAGDEHGGERIALREANGAVHGAVEIRLAADAVAPRSRLALVDEAGVEVGVDRHLPSRHRIEREPGGDFRNADRAVVDDDELDGDQHQEHDRADDEVAADHELAERHDDVAGASIPSAPCIRISRVDATFSDSRSSVSNSSSDGNTENSTGCRR